jgi:orotidine-5'-phosphate decarboxylase
MKRNTRLILSLDVTSPEKAVMLAEELSDSFDAFKIGYPLILAGGLQILRRLSEWGPCIADLKVADIPNTNRLICEQVLDAGASGIIAHAFVGKDSLLACSKAADDRRAMLFVVTEMSHPGALQFMAPVALNLAKLAVEVKAYGVVAPATRPDRIRLIRSIVGDIAIISPGAGAQGGSAASAIEAGADYLILGRSIYDSSDPKLEAARFLAAARNASL